MNSFNFEYFKKKLQINQAGEIRIISDSMSPLIMPDEILIVTPLPAKLERFDLLLFNYHGEPYCHFYWGTVANIDCICTKSLKYPQRTDNPILLSSLIGIIANKKITLWQKTKVYLKILWNKK